MIKKDLGFVLKRYNFRDTSLIVTLYTLGFGKIRGILKGFYTSKKEFSSTLDIFSLSEFIFYPKKNEIWLISHADLVSNYGFLSKDLVSAQIAASFLNLVDKTMQLWDENKYIFYLIDNCLRFLESEDPLKTFYTFLIKFLTLSGFKPELNHCLLCKKELRDAVYFSVSKGGLLCNCCRHKSADAQKISRQATRSLFYIQNTDFPLVFRLNLSPACEEEIFYILQRFLSYHFDFFNLPNPRLLKRFSIA